MLPVIALIGRPNVGKSTLFNRLTKTQDALVADFPGLTRDRLYGSIEHANRRYIVVDTGGLGVEDLSIDRLMAEQTELAIREADLVFFIVDGRGGLSPHDGAIAQRIRKFSKKFFLIINKIDGLNGDVVAAEFSSLGFDRKFPISATHGLGIYDLLSEVNALSLMGETEIIKDSFAPSAIKIAFIGKPNVGKSTLINQLLGEPRVVVYDLPGTTRDSIAIPFQRDEQEYILIDTAGVRRRSRIHDKIEKFSIIKTLQAIKESNVCLMLIDAKEGITDQDLQLLSFIIESGKSLLILVNKWDNLSQEDREQIKTELLRRLHFVAFASIRYISALYGKGISTLFQGILEAYHSATKKLSTPILTNMLHDLVTAHQPPMINNRRIKMRYAHAGGHNPPLIIIHGNQLESLPETYKRYLIKGFTEGLSLVGTPLKLEFKVGLNPYKDKVNKLTPRQMRSRKRLMKRVKK